MDDYERGCYCINCDFLTEHGYCGAGRPERAFVPIDSTGILILRYDVGSVFHSKFDVDRACDSTLMLLFTDIVSTI